MIAPDIDAYPVLKTYALLSYSGLTTVNTTTVSNGVYGSKPIDTYTGSFVGFEDSANATTAQTELTALVTDIALYTASLGGAVNIPAASGGVITFSPHINYYDSSTVTFTSVPIQLDAQNDPNAKFFITIAAGIRFNNVSSITLLNGAKECNVFWVSGSDITFGGQSPSPSSGIFIAQSSITFANASQTVGHLYAQTASVTFSGDSSVTACDEDVICYAKGSLILTKQGYVPIENIKAGSMVVTKGKIDDGSFKEEDLRLDHVLWISKFKVHHLTSKTRPICIKRNALGENSPFRDLYVSPEHGLIVNGQMIAAKKMVNGRTIYQDNECDSVEYYHLECDKHSGIFANGLLAETYLEGNNRHVFDDSVKLSQKYLNHVKRMKNAKKNNMGKIYSLRV